MSEKGFRGFSSSLKNIFTSKKIDDQTWEKLGETLIRADFGPRVTDVLVSEVQKRVERDNIVNDSDISMMLREVLEERLARFDSTLQLQGSPSVVLFVGVNGVGKTTTIGKFAQYIRNFDKTVVVAAADTFRAAAAEQLATWARRSGSDIIMPDAQGQDPAAVAYKAVQFAITNNRDVVLIDTAGRLHTKTGLMDELRKIRRVVEKLVPVTEVLLVLDAVTGQNGLVQAEAFLEAAGVTGLVITKLDGSAKAGFVVSVQESTSLPVKLIGEGESATDLTGFTPRIFAQKLTS